MSHPKIPLSTKILIQWNEAHGQPSSGVGWRDEPVMSIAAAIKGGFLSSGTRAMRLRIAEGPHEGASPYRSGYAWFAQYDPVLEFPGGGYRPGVFGE